MIQRSPAHKRVRYLSAVDRAAVVKAIVPNQPDGFGVVYDHASGILRQGGESRKNMYSAPHSLARSKWVPSVFLDQSQMGQVLAKKCPWGLVQ